MANRPLSWKPVRKGETYCSSACGSGCTWKAYREAVQNAERLAKTLGQFWKPRVWENLGWHWAARLELPCNLEGGRSTADVHPSVVGGTYWCSIVLAGEQSCATAHMPKVALRRAMKLAESKVMAQTIALAQLSERWTTP